MSDINTIVQSTLLSESSKTKQVRDEAVADADRAQTGANKNAKQLFGGGLARLAGGAVVGGAAVSGGAKVLRDKLTSKTQGEQLKDAATSKLSDVVDKGKEIAGTVKQAGGDALQSVKDNPKVQAGLAGAAGLTALGVGAKKYLSKKK